MAGRALPSAGRAKLPEAGRRRQQLVESENTDYTYEIHSDLVYQITLTVHPADYDGKLIWASMWWTSHHDKAESLTIICPTIGFIRIG